MRCGHCASGLLPDPEVVTLSLAHRPFARFPSSTSDIPVLIARAPQGVPTTEHELANALASLAPARAGDRTTTGNCATRCTARARAQGTDEHELSTAVDSCLARAGDRRTLGPRGPRVYLAPAPRTRPASEFKAWITTIHAATKQVSLSKELQLDAQELVRRAERGVGKAIRQGQNEGTVETWSEGRGRGGLVAQHGHVSDDSGYMSEAKTRPLDLASESDLSGNRCGIYAMTDDVTDEQFEEAVTEAKAENNLSRANVVRKIKGQGKKTERPEHFGQEKTPQRPEHLRNTHHPKTTRIVEQTALTLNGLAMGLAMVEPAGDRHASGPTPVHQGGAVRGSAALSAVVQLPCTASILSAASSSCCAAWRACAGVKWTFSAITSM